MFKRLFHAMVLFFAVYAFVFVPLGQKTALEHVRAIAGTPAAKNAASELGGGVKRLAHELRDQARRATEAVDEQIAGEEPPVEAQPPAAPETPAKTTPERRARDGEDKPRKVAPRLTREPAAASSAPSGSAGR
jgi:hypothetical protein